MKIKQQQIQVSSNLHNLIHVLIEIEKQVTKAKILIDEMIKDDDK